MSEPGSASDRDEERPRPRYGEYATPEEQRARIRDSNVEERLSGVAVPAPPVAPAESSVQAGPIAGPVVAAQADSASRPARPRLADRIATFALLGYGLINVLLTVPGMLDFGSVADLYFEIVGIPGEFTNIAQGQLWGTVAAVILTGGFLLTAWISLRRLRTGRLTWWVPLVGAVVTHLAVSICILVPFFGDPAFMTFLGGTAG